MRLCVRAAFLTAAVVGFGSFCGSVHAQGRGKNTITRKEFGKTPEGRTVYLYTLRNAAGLEAGVITYGAAVTELKVPDRKGRLKDIVLGYRNLEGYLNDTTYFGATVGRYAGRIAKGRFSLDGVEYRLTINNGPNHIHGGLKGFNKVVWNGSIDETEEGPVLVLTYLSRDGEEGYPGNVLCTVTYALTDRNELKIGYEARSDRPTIINLTHHSYFNLAGYDAGDVLDHVLTVFADFYAPAGPEWLIPTGEIWSVRSRAVDFTTPGRIGDRLHDAPRDFGGNNGGYDLNYVLKNRGRLEIAARVCEPESGRVMEVFTSEPALQVYTSNFMDGTTRGKGVVYKKYSGLCLEPEHFPDSPHKPHFPSVVLRPGRTYRHTIIYKFSTK